MRKRGLGVFASLALAAGTLHAEPGTHAPAVSTWDTRASTVEVAFRPGFLSGGHFHALSYYANFAATSGNFAAEFGIHYLNARPGENQGVLQGLSATAIGLYSAPVGPRYENGVPKTAVGVYGGIAPSALVNGRASFVSIPLLLGLGVPWSPSKSVTIAPWVEASPGVNLDTRIKTTTLTAADIMGSVNGNTVTLTNADINRILEKSVEFNSHVTASLRAGLDLEFRLGDSAALDLSAMFGSLGSAFSGPFVGWLGAGIVVRWDNIVPAVLPPEQRVVHEDCASVELRYQTCQALKNAPYIPGGYGQPPSRYAPQYAPPATPSGPYQWNRSVPPTLPPPSPALTPPPRAPTPAAPHPPSQGGVPTGAFPP